MVGSLISGFWHREACSYPAGYDEPPSGKAQQFELKVRTGKLVWVLTAACLFLSLPPTCTKSYVCYGHPETGNLSP